MRGAGGAAVVALTLCASRCAPRAEAFAGGPPGAGGGGGGGADAGSSALKIESFSRLGVSSSPARKPVAVSQGHRSPPPHLKRPRHQTHLHLSFAADGVDDAGGEPDEDFTVVEPGAEGGEVRASKHMPESIPKLNSVVMTGRVGQDPTPRYFDDGNCVVNISLAVKREYHPLERKARAIKYGEEETDWWPLEIWGREAEYCAKVIKKGMRVGIKGTFDIDIWTDREQQKRTKPKLCVQSIELLESRSEIEARLSTREGGADSPLQQQYQQRNNNGASLDSSYQSMSQGADGGAFDGYKDNDSLGSPFGSNFSNPSGADSSTSQEEKLPSFFDDF